MSCIYIYNGNVCFCSDLLTDSNMVHHQFSLTMWGILFNLFQPPSANLRQRYGKVTTSLEFIDVNVYIHEWSTNPPPLKYPPPEIAGIMSRAYDNPLVSLKKAGYETLISGRGGCRLTNHLYLPNLTERCITSSPTNRL